MNGRSRIVFDLRPQWTEETWRSRKSNEASNGQWRTQVDKSKAGRTLPQTSLTLCHPTSTVLVTLEELFAYKLTSGIYDTVRRRPSPSEINCSPSNLPDLANNLKLEISVRVGTGLSICVSLKFYLITLSVDMTITFVNRRINLIDRKLNHLEIYYQKR